MTEGTFSHYLLDPDNIAIGAQLPLHPDVKADITTAHHFVCSNGDVLNLATKVTGPLHALDLFFSFIFSSAANLVYNLCSLTVQERTA